LDEGLACLIEATTRQILTLTGFTLATISSGRSRPARGPRLSKPAYSAYNLKLGRATKKVLNDA
jgi:hypothetical protein